MSFERLLGRVGRAAARPLRQHPPILAATRFHPILGEPLGTWPAVMGSIGLVFLKEKTKNLHSKKTNPLNNTNICNKNV